MPSEDPVLIDVRDNKLHFSDGTYLRLRKSAIVIVRTEDGETTYSIDDRRGGLIARGRLKSACVGFVRYVSGQ